MDNATAGSAVDQPRCFGERRPGTRRTVLVGGGRRPWRTDVICARPGRGRLGDRQSPRDRDRQGVLTAPVVTSGLRPRPVRMHRTAGGDRRGVDPGVRGSCSLPGRDRCAITTADARPTFRIASVAQFLLELEPGLYALRNEFLANTWRPGAPRLLAVRAPKPRTSLAPFRGRVVHQGAGGRARAAHRAPPDRRRYACRPGRGQPRGARARPRLGAHVPRVHPPRRRQILPRRATTRSSRRSSPRIPRTVAGTRLLQGTTSREE